MTKKTEAVAKKSLESVKGMLGKINRDMVENVVIFVLLCVIVYLLVQRLSAPKKTEQFTATHSDDKCVLFFAPWCPHCKGYLKEWEQLGQSQEVNGRRIQIEKVDCDANQQAATDNNIEGFPTVLLFLDGERHEHNGERTAEGVMSFLNERCA